MELEKMETKRLYIRRGRGADSREGRGTKKIRTYHVRCEFPMPDVIVMHN